MVKKNYYLLVYLLIISATATFPLARQDVTCQVFPQAIAHRGYKTKYPENTMGAFVDAVRAGVHAIETDLHLSRDGIVVISHVRS